MKRRQGAFRAPAFVSRPLREICRNVPDGSDARSEDAATPALRGRPCRRTPPRHGAVPGRCGRRTVGN
ncbi:MAG: hypothetical protein ACYC5X_00765 [Syntrophales bacterium]